MRKGCVLKDPIIAQLKIVVYLYHHHPHQDHLHHRPHLGMDCITAINKPDHGFCS